MQKLNVEKELQNVLERTRHSHFVLYPRAIKGQDADLTGLKTFELHHAVETLLES